MRPSKSWLAARETQSSPLYPRSGAVAVRMLARSSQNRSMYSSSTSSRLPAGSVSNSEPSNSSRHDSTMATTTARTLGRRCPDKPLNSFTSARCFLLPRRGAATWAGLAGHGRRPGHGMCSAPAPHRERPTLSRPSSRPGSTSGLTKTLSPSESVYSTSCASSAWRTSQFLVCLAPPGSRSGGARQGTAVTLRLTASHSVSRAVLLTGTAASVAATSSQQSGHCAGAPWSGSSGGRGNSEIRMSSQVSRAVLLAQTAEPPTTETSSTRARGALARPKSLAPASERSCDAAEPVLAGPEESGFSSAAALGGVPAQVERGPMQTRRQSPSPPHVDC